MVEELPFDQYQRYRIVADILSVLHAPRRRLRILDVGGQPGTLAQFLPGDIVVVADRISGPHERSVVSLGERLPFKKSSFDVSVSVDAIEHVGAPEKLNFLKEMVRVSRGRVVLAAPFRTPEVAAAEAILHRFVRDGLRVDGCPIEEHTEVGLPELSAVEKLLAAEGFRTVVLPNGYLYNWLPMLLVDYWLRSIGCPPDVHAGFNSFYNRNLYRGDNREPSYRKVIVASRSDARWLKSIQKRFRGKEAEEPRQERGVLLSDLLIQVLGLQKIWLEKEGLERERQVFEKEQERAAVERENAEKMKAQVGRLGEELERTQRELAARAKEASAIARELAAERARSRQMGEERAELVAGLESLESERRSLLALVEGLRKGNEDLMRVLEKMDEDARVVREAKEHYRNRLESVYSRPWFRFTEWLRSLGR